MTGDPSDHLSEESSLVAREFLPGQFDQRADSAGRCLNLIYPDRKIEVKCSEIFLIRGKLSGDELHRIEKWLINPVDSRKCRPGSSSLGEKSPEPEDVPILSGFRSLDETGLEKLKNSLNVALALPDMEFIQQWFAEREGRDPTLAELRALDTYWSDHCRHTTFETELTNIEIADELSGTALEAEISDALSQWDQARESCGRGDKPRTLMDLATIAGREARKQGMVEDWDLSEEINACTLKVNARIDGRNEKWLLSFKNETHNHPTEIEPYGGASTCLGGAIRDPLSGRAYVHQALRVSGGADPRQNPADARPGKLPQRLIAHGAAEGYAGYGNQIGLATAVVREFYHPGYEAKRLECGAVMGASPAANVIREVPVPGDVVILVGGRTGRDGIGGATGSSMAHDGSSLERAGAEVQKGNPPEERKLQRLFRNPRATRLIRRCNDFGAGGVAVAVGELADGLTVSLDEVAVKYQGLNGLELALSESQERMAVVVAERDATRFISLAEAENLEARPVARVTGDRRLRMDWRGTEIINLNRDLLDSNGVRRQAEALIGGFGDGTRHSGQPDPEELPIRDGEALKRRLASLEVCSRKGLEERFDGSVGGATVLAAHAGLYQATPAEASVHLLPGEGRVETAGMMTLGFNPVLGGKNAFRAGQWALIEALARTAAAGGNWRKVRFSLQEFFGRTDRGAEAWGRPLTALLGALTVQRQWNLPAIGGKDSMSGSYEELDVPPTLIAFAASSLDAGNTVSAAISGPGMTLALLGPGIPETDAPDFEALESSWDTVEALNRRKVLDAAATVGPAGWMARAAIMAFGNRVGLEFSGSDGSGATDYGSVLCACRLSAEELSSLAGEAGTDCRILGRTVPGASVSWPEGQITLAELEQAWTSTLEAVWPMGRGSEDITVGRARSGRPAGAAPQLPSRKSPAIARPRVCIPVFPGTNGEDDARRAFNRAGALAAEHVFLDRDPAELHSALASFAREIDNSQILYISGGFSAGDEPDGAGKYIAAILRQDEIARAITGLLERDGLVLGICNGFQALLKSGWLEAGKAAVPGPDSPTLAQNRIGRHVSRVVRTVAAGCESPWLTEIGEGDVHSVPVSHGEGRFTAPEAVLDRLMNAGRIPFQYCSPDGVPSMAGEWNPNGSDRAVEALLSPCGRILGKMGHSERWRPGTLIDIPGMEREQPLVPGGVKWFL